MDVKDKLEISDVQGFQLTSLPQDLSHDYEQQLKDYLSGFTILA